MELQKQVTSLEISKRLKELGVKQESYFWWENTRLSSSNPDWRIHSYSGNGQGDISAFTVAELGEMLPSAIKNNSAFLYIWKDDANQWRVDYSKWSMQKIGHMIEKEDAQVNAYGKMLIYLLENNLLPTDINQNK